MRRRGKTLLIIIVVLLFVFSFYCSKDQDETKGKAAKKKKPLPITPEIAEVAIDPPEPISTDFVRAIPRLKHAKMRFVTYSYQWYVNDEPVPDGNKKRLDRKHFKKGDTVYCRVKAKRGKYESKTGESDEIEIGNAPPMVHSLPVSPFRVPGEFTYAIKASDPDGDTLTYRLVSPQEQNIFINPDTGEIEWYISQVPKDLETSAEQVSPRPEDEEITTPAPKPKPKEKASQLSPFIKIIFEVSDSDGASTISSINLNLSKGAEQPE